MPLRGTVRVDGLRQLGENMRTLKTEVALKAGGRATGSGAQIFKRLAKSHLKTSPSIRTGLLEKNVIAKKLRKNQTEFTSEHIVTVRKVQYPAPDPNSTKEVAGWVERGTVHSAAEPFLRPAFDEGSAAAINKVIDTLKSALADATSGMQK